MIEVHYDPITEALLGDTPCRDLSPIDREIMLEQRVQEAFDEAIRAQDVDTELTSNRRDLAGLESDLEDAERKLEHYKKLLRACKEWRDGTHDQGEHQALIDAITACEKAR